MGDWYYADGDQQRHGPLSQDALIELFHGGRIGLDTWVWREGLPQWRQLSGLARELGLAAPVPAQTEHVRRILAAPSPKRGLSGGVIALLVVAALSIPALIALAAVALPAYKDYVVRARLVGVVAGTRPLRAAVGEYRQRHGSCPGNRDLGMPEGMTIDTSRIALQATVGTFSAGRCGIELRLLRSGETILEGKTLRLEHDAGSGEWECSSELDDRYLPRNCGG